MSLQKSAAENNEPALCNQCHKFYGTKSTDWLCSSCYKEHNLQSKKGKKEEKVELVAEPSRIEETLPVLSKEEVKKEEKMEQIQKDRKRCFACQKKVGLLGVQCKCKFVFCNAHRMPEDHKCEFNFKQKGMKELQKTVIKVDHGKISQI